MCVQHISVICHKQHDQVKTLIGETFYLMWPHNSKTTPTIKNYESTNKNFQPRMHWMECVHVFTVYEISKGLWNSTDEIFFFTDFKTHNRVNRQEWNIKTELNKISAKMFM